MPRNNPPLPLLTTPAYRVVVQFLCDNQVCIITQDYIMQTQGQSSLSEYNIANAFKTAVQSSLQSVLDSTSSITSYKVACLSVPARMPYILASGVAGNVSNTHIPLEMAVIVTKQTLTKGQHGRGRMYFPGVPSTFVSPLVDPNRINLTGSTAYQAVASAMTSASIVDSGNQALPAVTQRVHGGAAVVNGQTVASFVVRALLGTVRRRRIGRGK